MIEYKGNLYEEIFNDSHIRCFGCSFLAKHDCRDLPECRKEFRSDYKNTIFVKKEV